eukprot:tig00000180_g13627.t1
MAVPLPTQLEGGLRALLAAPPQEYTRAFQSFIQLPGFAENQALILRRLDREVRSARNDAKRYATEVIIGLLKSEEYRNRAVVERTVEEFIKSVAFGGPPELLRIAEGQDPLAGYARITFGRPGFLHDNNFHGALVASAVTFARVHRVRTDITWSPWAVG